LHGLRGCDARTLNSASRSGRSGRRVCSGPLCSVGFQTLRIAQQFGERCRSSVCSYIALCACLRYACVQVSLCLLASRCQNAKPQGVQCGWLGQGAATGSPPCLLLHASQLPRRLLAMRWRFTGDLAASGDGRELDTGCRTTFCASAGLQNDVLSPECQAQLRTTPGVADGRRFRVRSGSGSHRGIEWRACVGVEAPPFGAVTVPCPSGVGVSASQACSTSSTL